MNQIRFKKPSLRRNDFLGVLDALIYDRVYPGIIYNETCEHLKEKNKFKNPLLLPSKWVFWKFMLSEKFFGKKIKKVLIPDIADPYYYFFFNSSNIEVIPIDIDANTLLPSVDDILKHNPQEDTLLVLSYPFGVPQDVSEIQSMDINIVADLTGSFNVDMKNKGFDICLYSFGDEDIITSGDGICVDIKDNKIFKKVVSFVKDYKLELSDYNCALLLAQLKQINSIIRSRKKLFDRIKKVISNESLFIDYDQYEGANYNNLILYLEDISYLTELLDNTNIEYKLFSDKPISFYTNSMDSMNFSKKICKSAIMLPFYPTLKEEEIKKIELVLKKI